MNHGYYELERREKIKNENLLDSFDLNSFLNKD